MLWFKDLLLLFFPSTCLVCGKRLGSLDQALCFVCEMKMPKTCFEKNEGNPVSQIFWGRVPVNCGTALFRFEKGSVYQSLLHDLKYRGNRKAGLYLGRLLGKSLLNTPYASCKLMVPVPIHRRKLKQRGYNQSEIIARGAAEITGIPLATGLIKRKFYGRSQTSKNRQERFENMSDAFMLRDRSLNLDNLRILIIDDVITTGATLEACCRVLLSRFNCLIYIATVSYA